MYLGGFPGGSDTPTLISEGQIGIDQANMKRKSVRKEKKHLQGLKNRRSEKISLVSPKFRAGGRCVEMRDGGVSRHQITKSFVTVFSNLQFIMRAMGSISVQVI